MYRVEGVFYCPLIIVLFVQNIHYIRNTHHKDDQHDWERLDSFDRLIEQIYEEGSLSEQPHPVKCFVPCKKYGQGRPVFSRVETPAMVEEEVMLDD